MSQMPMVVAGMARSSKSGSSLTRTELLSFIILVSGLFHASCPVQKTRDYVACITTCF